MKKIVKKIDKREFLVILLLVALSLPSVVSFLHAGFPKTDDGDWMIIRFSAFYEALRDGQFPVRWLSRLNHGFGYPVSNFLYPGFMYLGVPLKVIGFSFVETIKILFAVSLVSSAVFSYLWLRTHFTKIASLTGSLVYLYLPYHLYDATVRGSLGEVLALSVIPFVLWSLGKRFFFISVMGIALLILSHNTLALLVLPLLFIYELLRLKREEWKKIVSIFLLGVGTAAFFWLPALIDLPATVFSKTTVSNHMEYFASIAQIGIATLLLLVFGGVSFFFKKDLKKNYLFIFWFVVFAVSLFMSSVLSSVVWNILPVQFVQFPFRFLSLTLLGGAVVTAYLIKTYNLNKGIVIGFLLLLFVTNGYYLARSYDVFDEGYYTTNQATTTVQNEYMPIGVATAPSEQAKSIMSMEKGTLENIIHEGTTYTATVKTSDEQKLIVSQVYFPGWVGYINGQRVNVSAESNTGDIVFVVPPGESIVMVQFEETPLRLFADAISVVSLLISGILIIATKKRRKHV